MSESVDGSLRTVRTSLKFITKTKQNKINKNSLFIFFPSSECVKIACLAIQRNPTSIKIIKELKIKSHFFFK